MPAPYPTYHVGDRVIVRTWDDMMKNSAPILTVISLFIPINFLLFLT